MAADKHPRSRRDAAHQASSGAEVSASEGWPVPIAEVRRAIDLELACLEELAGTLKKERAALGTHPSLTDRKQLQRLAYRFALERIGGTRLTRARRKLHRSSAKLSRTAQAIADHNRTLESKGLLSGLLEFLSDSRATLRLAARRERAMADYREALAHWRAVRAWLQGPEQVAAAIRLGDRTLATLLAMQRRYREIEIRLRLVLDDIARRKALRQLLGGAPQDSRIMVHHRRLNAAIEDPSFESQLRNLPGRTA